MRKRRFLSLFLAVAVMATMIMSLPLTANAEVLPDATSDMKATDNDFVEWDFATLTSDTITYYQNEDCSDAGSSSPKVDPDLVLENYIKPTGSNTETGASLSIGRKGSSFGITRQGTNAEDYTTLGGKTYKAKEALGGKLSWTITYTLDPKVKENNYESANVYISFGINDASSEPKAQNGYFTCGSDQSVTVHSAADTADGPKFATFKIENVKSEITFNANKEPFVFYIGIEYISGSDTPAPPAYSKPGGTTTYTWDFTDINWFKNAYSAGSDIISDQLEKKAILTNPGSKINNGANNWPAEGCDTKPLAKLEDKKVNALQFDIPEGLSAKLTIQIGSTSSGKSWYFRNGISDTSAETKERIATITAEKKHYYGIPNEFDVECGKTYYLDSSDSNGFLGKITLTVTSGAETPAGFGEAAYDSGVYGTEPQLGVIRFFQEYTGEDDITGFGFYIVDKDGTIIENAYNTITDPNASFDINNNAGFYGDLKEIPDSAWRDMYYAMAYVKSGDVVTMSNKIIPGKVHPSNVLTNYPE